MGFWSALAGIGTSIAGVVTGQPELIGAGIGLIGSGVQSDQVSKAANAQEAAAKQALGIQQQVYNQQQQNLAPYMSLGVGAAGNLQKLLGLPATNNGITGPPAVPTNARQSLATIAPNAYTYNPSTGVTTYNGYDPSTGQITGTPPVTIDPRTGQWVVNGQPQNPVAAQSQSGYGADSGKGRV